MYLGGLLQREGRGRAEEGMRWRGREERGVGRRGGPERVKGRGGKEGPMTLCLNPALHTGQH